MLSSIEDSPLHLIANPKSMAFFGASNNIVSMGTNQLLSLLSLGYEGRVYPVHPKEEKVQGLKAYRSVLDLPEVPDVAMMVLPTQVVNPTLEECGRKGIKRAIIVSGGFKEVGGDGAALEQEMVRIAARYGLRILGPNGLGVANPYRKLNTTFIPHEGQPGFIGLASQSGSFVTQMFNYLANLGLGFSTALSVGNEANIDLVDALEYLGACPHTKVIAMYIEGLKRGRAFLEVARKVTRRKPVVVLYIGGSEAGRRAGLSHTGSLAGPDDLYGGVFRQSGVIRAESVTELFDFCWALGALPAPRGNRVIIQTHSGGPGAAAADACGRAGLQLPALADETRSRLAPYLPHTGSCQNPVDLTFTKNPGDFYSRIPKVLLADPGADMLLVYFFTPEPVLRRGLSQMGVPPEKLDEEATKVLDLSCRAVLKTIKEQDKPVIGYTWRSLEESFSRKLTEGGVPLYPEAERAARAMSALVRYHAYRVKMAESKIQV
ncbi:MAG: CoA-binding protein [Thermodesulfobacteriota bacterium]